jgi:hypothetical protein
MSYDFLIGRTIVAITDSLSAYSDDVVLELDDGTFVEVQGTGYEADGIAMVARTTEEWMALVAEHEAEEQRRDEERRIRQEKIREDQEKWRVVREHMRTVCTPRAFALWEKKNPMPGSVGAFGAILKDIYGEAIQAKLDANRVLFGVLSDGNATT